HRGCNRLSPRACAPGAGIGKGILIGPGGRTVNRTGLAETSSETFCEMYVTFGRPAYIDQTMEPHAGDWGLLRRYAHDRDEAAFAQLVRRHVNVVFSAALRRVGDRHLAEDVTQAVFVILSQKARSLCNGDGALSAWLLKCVRY